MKCPTCGTGKLAVATRGMPYTYKGRSTVIKAVTGRRCDNPHCGEVVMEIGESIRTTQEMLEFNKKVNGELVPIDLITGVRRRLMLTQQQAAHVFGGGTNAFSRYESGKTKPPVALVKLFRILDKHPNLFAEIERMESATPTTNRIRGARLATKPRAMASKRKRRVGVRAAHA